jgi:hypothetical protein
MKFGSFDIESKRWIHFEVLGFYNGTDYKKYTRIGDFLNSLDKRCYQGFKIYAHNGGHFDFLFILEPLLERGWVDKIIEKAGRILAIKVNTGRVQFMFADSYAILPQSLKSLSEQFDTEHKKTEMDYKKISKNDPRTLAYLENDVLCLQECITKFFALPYIDTPQLTIASQALNTFRSQFMPAKMMRVRLDEEDLFREKFYSGGRVEVYKGYGSSVNYYDVNSLFPYAMLEEMPCGNMRRVRSFDRDRIGFYEVEIASTPEWYISPLLVKGRKNFFVNGKGTYYLSSAMLLYLRKEFGIRFKINWGFVFAHREELFRDYVNTFYKVKQENKGNALGFLSKLMLNSLYGKMAQSRMTESLTFYNEDMIGFRDAHPVLQSYGMVLIKEYTHSQFILPYVAAYITDLARLYHFQLMQEAPEKMFYCDTDSLITSANLDSFCSDKIGELHNEGRFAGVFLNAKSYALKNSKLEKIAFKGFATEEFTFADFLKAAHGKTLTQDRERMLSYRECLHRKAGIKDKAGKFLILADQEKTVKSPYDKRLTLPSRKHIFETKALQFSDIGANGDAGVRRGKASTP